MAKPNAFNITSKILKTTESGGQADVTVEVKADGKVLGTTTVRVSRGGKEGEDAAIAVALQQYKPQSAAPTEEGA